MQASKPLNREFAIALALAGMWLLSCVGNFAWIHPDDWWFVPLRGYDATTILQIGGFYVALTGAHLPAASVAGMIMSASDFPRPLRTTFWTMASYHLFFSAIAAVHWPWAALHDLDQSIPILAYLLSTLLLIGVSMFFAWFMRRWHKIFQRYCAH
jgi:hypothetical protein